MCSLLNAAVRQAPSEWVHWHQGAEFYSHLNTVMELVHQGMADRSFPMQLVLVVNSMAERLAPVSNTYFLVYCIWIASVCSKFSSHRPAEVSTNGTFQNASRAKIGCYIGGKSNLLVGDPLGRKTYRLYTISRERGKYYGKRRVSTLEEDIYSLGKGEYI
jgi:hypothetical protein